MLLSVINVCVSVIIIISIIIRKDLGGIMSKRLQGH